MSNQKGGYFVTREEEEAALESLPLPLREVLMRAPFNYISGTFADGWKNMRRSGGDYAAQVKTYRALMVSMLADDLQKKAFECYGPDHPDAQRNRVTGRPLDNPP